MNKNRTWAKFLLGVGLTGLLIGMGQRLSAQQSNTLPGAKAVQAGQGQEQEHTFVGTIGKSHGDLVLKSGYASNNPDAKTTYKLDDQERAKQYVGKNVKVTGSLDASTNTIHVSEIKPAS